ncbi:hypothetical protein [Endozoicomonas acroporae]|uniref:hypothetical protein n=1 Tax=Endozoicomonas acroporae TaxID=1701104 RepID=UPI003D799322
MSYFKSKQLSKRLKRELGDYINGEIKDFIKDEVIEHVKNELISFIQDEGVQFALEIIAEQVAVILLGPVGGGIAVLSAMMRLYRLHQRLTLPR